MLILGIESSCDDTAAAVLEDDSRILSNIISSQDIIHERFGGIVPELASRSHLESITPIVNEALAQAHVRLSDIDLIAVTQGPGLIGSLLVGFSYAKALSYTKNIPYIGVNHIEGHLLSPFLEDDKPSFPYIALIVSGGNTALFLCEDHLTFKLLGQTRDDAAGEAFDKVAKMLDLGYPGGPVVSKMSIDGDPQAFKFPRAWLDHESFDFSFSGLKTSVLSVLKSNQPQINSFVHDVCASFQEAVIDVLITKTINAAISCSVPRIVIGGGVSANANLRKRLEEMCMKNGFDFFLPRPQYCTDNGAMIALTGYYQHKSLKPSGYSSDVYSRSALG